WLNGSLAPAVSRLSGADDLFGNLVVAHVVLLAVGTWSRDPAAAFERRHLGSCALAVALLFLRSLLFLLGLGFRFGCFHAPFAKLHIQLRRCLWLGGGIGAIRARGIRSRGLGR